MLNAWFLLKKKGFAYPAYETVSAYNLRMLHLLVVTCNLILAHSNILRASWGKLNFAANILNSSNFCWIVALCELGNAAGYGWSCRSERTCRVSNNTNVSAAIRLDLSLLAMCHDGWLARYRPELLPTIYSIYGTISDLPPCMLKLCLLALYFLVKCSEHALQT